MAPTAKPLYWGDNGVHEFWESEDHELVILRNHEEKCWSAHRNHGFLFAAASAEEAARRLRAVQTEPLQDVILTLQYCLETFEQACQCGRCDPCTNGQKDIKRSIHTIESLQFQRRRRLPQSSFGGDLSDPLHA